MPVLTFQHRFVPKLLDGSKRQTIRPTRKRPIRPGQTLFIRIWTGRPYMSPQHELFQTTCLSTAPALITQALAQAHFDDFAKLDGFQTAEELVKWFHENHGLPFHGQIIRW